jgi:hypothetical protein
MNAELKLTDTEGTLLKSFIDPYTVHSLFGMINETLGWNDTARELSWWAEAPKDPDNLTQSWKCADQLRTHLEEALVQLTQTQGWKRGYGSGANLTLVEREHCLRELVRLLGILTEGQRNDRLLIWSV